MRLALGLLALLVLAPGALAATTTVDVVLRDDACPEPDRFCIEPAVVQLEPEDDLLLRVTNRGHVLHNLTFAPGVPEALRQQGMSEPLAPAATANVRIAWKDAEAALDGEERGSFGLRCGLRGHEALGMRAELAIGEVGGEERTQPSVPALLVLMILAAITLVRRRRTD